MENFLYKQKRHSIHFYFFEQVRDGYSREQEFEADKAALILLKNAGYDPEGFDEILGILEKKSLTGKWKFTNHEKYTTFI